MHDRRGILALAILLLAALTLPGCSNPVETGPSGPPQVVQFQFATEVDPITMAPLNNVDGTFPIGT